MPESNEQSDGALAEVASADLLAEVVKRMRKADIKELELFNDESGSIRGARPFGASDELWDNLKDAKLF